MQIGIISDTHGKLSPLVFDHFQKVQYIFHAGDMGSLDIIVELEALAPVYAVSGNIDGWNIKKQYPQILFEKISQNTICMTHDIINVKRFSYEMFKNGQHADIIIHGHTHRPSAEIFQKKLFINPGSATYPRNIGAPTIAILNLADDEPVYKFIDLEENK